MIPPFDHGRIEISGVQQGGDQRRGRGLAVGAADGDASFFSRISSGQHFGAPHHGQALRTRRGEFRDCRALIAVETTTHGSGRQRLAATMTDRGPAHPCRAAAA